MPARHVFDSPCPSARRPARLARFALAATLALGGGVAVAQTTPAPTAAAVYDIPAGPLAEALARFAQRAGVSLAIDADKVKGLRTPGLRGTYGVDEGFKLLLRGSGQAIGKSSAGYVLVPAAAPAAAVPAQPQSPAPDSATTLPQVKVTGTREGALPAPFAGGKVARGANIGALGNVDFLDTPMSIVAFTSEFRDDTQALSVSDMLKYSVSAQTPQAGPTTTTDVVYVRGFNIGSFDGTLLGLPGLLARMPPVEAVERVELVLGANSFINGQPASVGGNINVVPKRAGEEPLARVGLTYRTESIFGSTVDVGQRFGPDNALGIRVNAGYSDGDTEYENGKRRVFARALAIDHRSATTRVSFDYMGAERRLPAESWFILAPGVSVPDADRANRDFRQPWTFYKDIWDTAVLKGEWDIAPDWTVSAAYGRMWSKLERLNQVYELTSDDGSISDIASWGGTLGHARLRSTVQSSDVSVRGEVVTGPLKHELRMGYNNYGSRTNYNGGMAYPNPSNIYSPIDYPEPPIGSPTLSTDSGPRVRNTGLFLSDQISMFDDRLRVMLGARRAHYAGEQSKKKWSPAYGVLFKVQPTVSVYANRLQALEPGFQVDQDPAFYANAGEVLAPLAANQTELGVKAEFGKLGLTAAVFEIDKPSYFRDPTTRILGANGRQVNRGVELSLFGEATTGLRLYSSATYLDPKLTKNEDPAIDGNTAPSVSRVLATVHADWDIPGVEGLALLGAVSYNGRAFFDSANSQSLKAWTRADSGVRYRTTLSGKQAVFRLTVDNLLGKKYFVAERETLYLAPGRTIGASMTLDL
jgi:iron complex outermembrane receptor protein